MRATQCVASARWWETALCRALVLLHLLGLGLPFLAAFEKLPKHLTHLLNLGVEPVYLPAQFLDLPLDVRSTGLLLLYGTAGSGPAAIRPRLHGSAAALRYTARRWALPIGSHQIDLLPGTRVPVPRSLLLAELGFPFFHRPNLSVQATEDLAKLLRLVAVTLPAFFSFLQGPLGLGNALLQLVAPLLRDEPRTLSSLGFHCLSLMLELFLDVRYLATHVIDRHAAVFPFLAVRVIEPSELTLVLRQLGTKLAEMAGEISRAFGSLGVGPLLRRAACRISPRSRNSRTRLSLSRLNLQSCQLLSKLAGFRGVGIADSIQTSPDFILLGSQVLQAFCFPSWSRQIQRRSSGDGHSGPWPVQGLKLSFNHADLLSEGSQFRTQHDGFFVRLVSTLFQSCLGLFGLGAKLIEQPLQNIASPGQGRCLRRFSSLISLCSERPFR